MAPQATPTEPSSRAKASGRPDEWIERDETSHGPDSVSISTRLPRDQLVHGSSHGAHPRDRSGLVRGLVIGASLAGALFLCTLAVGLVGATRIDSAERVGAAADEALFRRVDQEARWLDRPFVSDQGDEAAALFASIRAEGPVETRRARVADLARVLSTEARALEQRGMPSEEALRLGLEESVRGLRASAAEAELRHQRVIEVRGSLSGRLATLAGA